MLATDKRLKDGVEGTVSVKLVELFKFTSLAELIICPDDLYQILKDQGCDMDDSDKSLFVDEPVLDDSYDDDYDYDLVPEEEDDE